MEAPSGVRKGAWTEEEDVILRKCVEKYGEGNWHQVPGRAGLNRCRKSCRLRWLNYLKPNIKRGVFQEDEVDLMLRLHKLLGNRWSLIAGRLPGRTANDVKNYWNTHLKKKKKKDIDASKHMYPEKHKPGNPVRVHVIRPRPRAFKNFKWMTTPAEATSPAAPAGFSILNSSSPPMGLAVETDTSWWESLLLDDTATAIEEEAADRAATSKSSAGADCGEGMAGDQFWSPEMGADEDWHGNEDWNDDLLSDMALGCWELFDGIFSLFFISSNSPSAPRPVLLLGAAEPGAFAASLPPPYSPSYHSRWTLIGNPTSSSAAAPCHCPAEVEEEVKFLIGVEVCLISEVSDGGGVVAIDRCSNPGHSRRAGVEDEEEAS